MHYGNAISGKEADLPLLDFAEQPFFVLKCRLCKAAHWVFGTEFTAYYKISKHLSLFVLGKMTTID